MTDKNESGLPGMGGEAPEFTPEGFDPRDLDGAEVMFDDGDLAVVAVPLSSVPKDQRPMGAAEVLGEVLGDGGPADILGALLGGGNPLDGVLTNFQQMQWALDEIDKAAERHGESDEDGPIHSAFPLLACVDQPYMAPEPVFRAHCAELLDRVAKGEDTKPGTEAETFGLLMDAMDYMPFCGGMTSLYLELSEKIIPESFAGFLAEEYKGDRTELEEHRKANAEDREEHRRELMEFHTRPRERAGRGPLPEDETED